MRRATTLALLGCAWLAALLAPGAQEVPLPDRDSFLGEVRKRLAGNDLIQSHYSFRQRTTELNLNPFGRMGTGAVMVYEVYPQPTPELTYRRLVERDGRAVPTSEIEAQDRRYLDKLERWRRELRREGQSEREARLKKEAEARERDQEQATEALSLFTFTLERRDTWEGQPAIVVAFTPKPTARPRTREGRVAAAFSGRAWIHEGDFEVMRVDAKAVDDVSFGFGVIARLHDGSTARFTRRRINGAWLPVESRFQGTGRALLVRKVVFEFERTYSDYRPFDPSEIHERLGQRR